MPLRLLARAAPLVLGAVALALWLRRRQAQRPVPPQRRTSAPPAAEPSAGAAPAPPEPPAPSPRTGRFDRAPAAAAPERQGKRFVRASERDSIDIVTVVDDLLGPTR